MTPEGHDFHRWIDPAAGRGAPQGAHTLTASEPERAAIAKWLDVPSVPVLSAQMTLERAGAKEAFVSGTIKADVELVCGVSLEPFVQSFTIPVTASFRRTATHPQPQPDSTSSAPELDIDADEPREWLQSGIDLGALVAEELSLALPDFPRKPGAELPAGLTDPADEPPPNPFAILKGLADKS
jgi:uncharacterized metal-binding protein YceD (DUF177 family)